jgi:hypothetical protein
MSEKQPNTVQCSQFEALLTDALDGVLAEDLRQNFEGHAASCPACGPMLAEARQGMLWLRGLEDAEPPKNLVHNILAATTVAEAAKEPAKAKAAETGWRARLWKPIRGIGAAMMQPRFVTSFAMAFFSLSLTLTLAGVKISSLAQIVWHPSELRRTVVLQYTQVETKVVQYYRNMRLVYEIESRVSELKKATTSEPAEQPQQQPSEQPKDDKNNKKDNNDTSGRPEERKEHYSRELNDRQLAYLRQSNEGA